MGFQSISTFNSTPLFQSLVAAKSVREPIFAFKLSTTGAGLTLGGIHHKLYTGPITYVPLVEVGYWGINPDSVNVRSKKIASGINAIVDSGTSFIVAPEALVDQLYASIPGAASAASTIGQGFYMFPCSNPPNVSFNIGGQKFAIAPEAFSLGQLEEGSDLCVGGI
jgi:hypothetical protein